MAVKDSAGIGCGAQLWKGISFPGWILIVFLALYNNLINLLPKEIHTRIYVPANLFVLFILFIFARKVLNLNMKELGYDTKNISRSIFTGLSFTFIVISVFIILLLIIPRIGIIIKPPRIEFGTLSELIFRVLVRIPLGTAFFEENLFRGISYGYLIKRFSLKKTIIITSILFAIWHIVPGLKVLTSNFQMGFDVHGLLIWSGGVLGAFFAGIFFAFLRYHSRNITGCILCHALINDLSLFVIYYLWK
uniref:CPBP family intramembrane metalloprotease n=1 Tax=candidate division WOR-3 bacterium TaxID=2052148 RepID=A0A7C6EH72_UNCW3